MHISTHDLHCCKPARLLQLAPSGGRPHRRQPPHPHASPHLTNNDGLRWQTDGRPPANAMLTSWLHADSIFFLTSSCSCSGPPDHLWRFARSFSARAATRAGRRGAADCAGQRGNEGALAPRSSADPCPQGLSLGAREWRRQRFSACANAFSQTRICGMYMLKR